MTDKNGLDNAIAATTRLSTIDGQKGELIVNGFALEELALHATFEETTYLLWYDRLPNRAELTELSQQLQSQRQLSDVTLSLLQQAAKKKLSVIEALRLGVDSLSLDTDTQNNQVAAIRLLAATPVIVANYWRLLQGETVIAPSTELGHAANFLYMLNNTVPTEVQARALETYLNTTIEHGLNASTFTARVIIATQSDMVSAIVGALGALKGPLHGGAPGPALQMVFDIANKDKAESYLRNKLEQGERLMGFGHRVYKARDPRADVLNAAAVKLYQHHADKAVYDLALYVEHTALMLLAEYKPGRSLNTNVEFYTALLLHGLGLNNTLFTPIFAISRTAGWLAHCFEQQQTGRLIRPKADYCGDKDRQWVAINAR